MACCCACRAERTWKWIFKQMAKGEIFILFTDEYAMHDLFRPLVCKVRGHDPVLYDENDPDCNCVVCKFCGRILKQ